MNGYEQLLNAICAQAILDEVGLRTNSLPKADKEELELLGENRRIIRDFFKSQLFEEGVLGIEISYDAFIKKLDEDKNVTFDEMKSRLWGFLGEM